MAQLLLGQPGAVARRGDVVAELLAEREAVDGEQHELAVGLGLVDLLVGHAEGPQQGDQLLDRRRRRAHGRRRIGSIVTGMVRPRRWLGRSGTGTGVVALDQGDCVAARGGVERRPGAGHAAADDDDVEALAGDRRQRLLAREHRSVEVLGHESATGSRSGAGLSCTGWPRWIRATKRSRAPMPTASRRPRCAARSGVRQ